MLFALPLTTLASSAISIPPAKIESDFHHYTTFFNARSQIILGSEDPRHGGGFSLGIGRRDPKLRCGNVQGELIWETYFLQTSSLGVGGDGANFSSSIGVLATGRYRWALKPDTNLFGDISFGTQWLDHTSNDVPLAFNTTPSLALGLEFQTHEGAVLAGLRLLHVSNAGRKNPNPGQNLLQFFIGFRY